MELPKGQTTLSKDNRPIHAIYWPGENGQSFTVGTCGVTKIEAYDENGHMANIPWVAVLKGEEIAIRAPADQVFVQYLTAADKQPF